MKWTCLYASWFLGAIIGGLLSALDKPFGETLGILALHMLIAVCVAGPMMLIHWLGMRAKMMGKE